MSLAERSSSKFHICPQSFASRPNVHFSDNLSAGDIISRHTSHLNIFPNFQNCTHCEKDLNDKKYDSLHLARKYDRIFVLGHYLFLVAHSFPQAMLSENCSLLGTDNVRGQISWQISLPNGGYCLYIMARYHDSRHSWSAHCEFGFHKNLIKKALLCSLTLDLKGVYNVVYCLGGH